ncbi:MAG: efflux RND transporter periplasmic adaptor subunit, partial [Planctomycetota bacterium]
SLIDERESPRGVLMVFDASSPSIQLMRLLGSSVGLKLTGLEQLQPGQLESCVRESRAWLAAQKRTLLLMSAILLLAVMLLPIRYRIGTDLELQPVEQRFVAVPFDAPLERVFVRPGDVVERDDLLATINPREIEFQLAGTRAELSRAIQERKRFLSEHDFAGSQLAEFESEKLRLDKELLEYQRENLEIRSPIGGIVVSGDLEPSEGMPMTRGKTLFEIAPLGECSVELLIPEEDFAHVRVGMNVAFYVHAYPGTKLEGSIERVHPRAELRDHVNVYVAELKLNDPDQRMRPGMRGRAKIIGDRHTLCWNLFHKALHASYRFLGW